MGFQVSGEQPDRFNDPSVLDLPNATRGFVSDSGRKSWFKVFSAQIPIQISEFPMLPWWRKWGKRIVPSY